MQLNIKARQVAGVTSIVAVAVLALSSIHLSSIARVRLQESYSRAQMLANAIFQRAREVVAESDDPRRALAEDSGIQSLLGSAIAFSNDVTYAAVLDSTGFAIAHAFPSQVGKPLEMQDDLGALLEEGPIEQLRTIYSVGTLELRQPLLLDSERFGSIRIGVSTLLIRAGLEEALRPAAATMALALLVATLVSMMLAQWLLRPIHVISSGLSRLGRGELDVRLDLPPGDEFANLESSFRSISAQLSAARPPAGAGQEADGPRGLEDAVGFLDEGGRLLFGNAAFRNEVPGFRPGQTIGEALGEADPLRRLLERWLDGAGREPVSETLSVDPGDGGSEQRLVFVQPVLRDRTFLGAVVVVRDLTYLNRVRTSISFSRKLAALGRLLAGLAHEVKNPLNAMTIHLELVRQKLGSLERPNGVPVHGTGPGSPGVPSQAVEGVLKHVDTIGSEIRRLDQVLQDFLKFARPEELKLEPLNVSSLIDEVIRLVEPDAARLQVAIERRCPSGLPRISGDSGMLTQALLNLALNACQAMPQGGVLRFRAAPADAHRLAVEVEDTGTGIAPEHLERIFDLYFSTKPKGSGVGLSLVYRIVQLHDGEVEVQSTPGAGTTFRLLLPLA